jgi:hypothetical protein
LTQADHATPALEGPSLTEPRIVPQPADSETVRRPWRFERRIALGLSPIPVLGLFGVLVGIALGPHGLNLLSRSVLSYLDPAVSVALAILGVLVGFGLDVRGPQERRFLAVATLEAGLTMTLVGAGVLLILSISSVPPIVAPWLLALMVGISASASSTTADEPSDSSRVLAGHIGDLDDVLPIVVGGLALAWMREGSLGAAAWLTIQTGLVALVIAIAVPLLIEVISVEDEKRVFTIGSLLLLGGAAESLSLSALMTGLVAGTFWNVTGGAASEHIRRDVHYIQHPAVVLLLVIAGAHLEYVPLLAGLVLLYLVLRTVGKIAGGRLIERALAPNVPSQMGLRLLSPGVVGVAFALNALQAGGPGRMAVVFAVAVVGSLGSELLSLMARPRGGQA